MLSSRFLSAFSLVPPALVVVLAAAQMPASAGGSSTLPATDAAVSHAVSRLTFGARPGDVERVKAMGLEAWIGQQLAPSRISDAALQPRLARLETLLLDPDTLAREYHIPARLEQRKALQGSGATDPKTQDPGPRPQISEASRKDQQIVTDLAAAKLLRAVYSERQLEEVLVDFWFNHFNVFAGKGPERVWVGQYEREAIRPHVLGNFRDMLEAVAKSEAMLFYLDNWQSGVPAAGGGREEGRNLSAREEGRNFSSARGGRQPQNGRRTLDGRQPLDGRRTPFARRATGINENYARELMELHTLGVDGGYTQDDIVNVARAFTGWTMGAPGEPGGFRFDESMHDRGEKTVLRHAIKAGGGMSDGLQVLDILAAHPSTARYIATKLAVRFVSDTPPTALVDRAAARFTATKGDLREVVRTIITSPEFFAPEAMRAKVKTPFEFVVSALRATGADVRNTLPLVRARRERGQPPYFCNPPPGWGETAVSWGSSGALVARMNFAVGLGDNRLRGVRIPLSSEQTLALKIGAPEFQRR